MVLPATLICFQPIYIGRSVEEEKTHPTPPPKVEIIVNRRHVIKIVTFQALFSRVYRLNSILGRQITTGSILLGKRKFDVKMLDVIVCPLSKAPLRYDEEKNVLICDEIGVSYPIKNGIPNLVPTDASKLEQTKSSKS